MPSSRREPFFVCTQAELIAGEYKRIEVIHEAAPASVIVFRRKSQCFAYLNHCVHMPRTLDCEKPTIFDVTGRFLRCSMHGIVYDPESG
ncbi:MAG: Rieske (2Fe-2S) protein [Gammaproteobacteria bacterium]